MVFIVFDKFGLGLKRVMHRIEPEAEDEEITAASFHEPNRLLRGAVVNMLTLRAMGHHAGLTGALTCAVLATKNPDMIIYFDAGKRRAAFSAGCV